MNAQQIVQASARDAEALSRDGRAEDRRVVTFPKIDIPANTPEFKANTLCSIDKTATALALQIIAGHPSPAELRARADTYEREGRGSRWLIGANRDLADAIDTDARLEAARQMGARTQDGTMRMFLVDYAALVRAAAHREVA